MQALAVIAALIAIGYGFAAAGVLGALTGLVAAVGIGSALAIAGAERGTGVALAGATRSAQRIGGILAAIGCLIGAYYGGWRFGWAWAIVGYVAGVASALLVRVLMRRSGQPRPRPNNRSIRTAAIPSRFDLDDVLHVTIIDEIRDKYSALLADESHPYSQCMYRPASLLPYPKEVIRRALEALLDFVEGRRDSRFLDVSIRTPEVADTVRTTLHLLDDFVDVPAEKLPTEPHENTRVGLDLQRSRR
jgi:hypothetical protein